MENGYKTTNGNPFRVMVGQMWQDNDKRMAGRVVEVREIAFRPGGWKAAVAATRGPRVTWVALTRFNHKRSTGFTKIADSYKEFMQVKSEVKPIEQTK